ncbi:SulP family inorganic anion transporter [Pseudonocardia halophobica]|uniref:SulP family inorganic anion transporter n=1 Tax=Pseudonocardia halophobica TaxID=29401 RepID=UPI003D8F307B
MSAGSDGGTWPVFGSLRGYRKAWFRPDVVAGLTVWAVLVPEALAYATIAGVPPVVGLYAAVPALVLYAAVGSSRHLVVGPMSATAALSAAIVAPLAAGDPARLVALTAALGLVVGVLGVLAGLIRLGFIASLISEPVLKGFIVGLALTIVIGQVPTLLGVPKTGGDFFEQLWDTISHLGDVDGLTVLVGGASLAAVLVLRRWLPVVPGSLVVVVLAIAVTAAFHLDTRGVDIVGPIEPGLPTVGLPTGIGPDGYLGLVGPAVGVLLVGFAEGLGAAKTYAVKAGYEVSANHELAGLGAANLGAGLCSGMVVNGSLSKTAVNGAAGARTQVSGLVVAVLTVLTLLLLTGLFERLPEATLSAVVIAAVVELVDVASLRRLYRVWTVRLGSIYGLAARADFAAAIATLLGVLVFDTLPGLFIGIAASMTLLLYRVSRPHVARLAKLGDVWLDVDRQDGHHPDPRNVVVRVEAGLFFANSDHVRARIERLCEPETRVVVLDAETSPFIDITAAQMLAQLAGSLRRNGIDLRIARDIGQVRDVMRTAVPEAFRHGVFHTVDDAVGADGAPGEQAAPP